MDSSGVNAVPGQRASACHRGVQRNKKVKANQHKENCDGRNAEFTPPGSCLLVGHPRAMKTFQGAAEGLCLLFSQEAGGWSQTPSLLNAEPVVPSVALFLNHVFLPLELILRTPFLFHGNTIQSYMTKDILLTVAFMSLPKRGGEPVPGARQQNLTASPGPARASICISYPTSPRPSHTFPLQSGNDQPGSHSMCFLGGEVHMGAHQETPD